MEYPEKSYYDVLGIQRDATNEQIKRAYRNQIKFFHPDVFCGSPEIAEMKSKELNEAYSVLIDASKRAAYDEWLSNHERQEPNTESEEESETEQEDEGDAAPKTEQQKEQAESGKQTEPGPEQTKDRPKRTFWETAQAVIAWMFLLMLPIGCSLYVLAQHMTIDLNAVYFYFLAPYAVIVLVGTYLTSYMVKHSTCSQPRRFGTVHLLCVLCIALTAALAAVSWSYHAYVTEAETAAAESRQQIAYWKTNAESYKKIALNRADEVEYLEEKAAFFDDHIVIILERGMLYHKYDCEFFQDFYEGTYWLLTKEVAEDLGYESGCDCTAPQLSFNYISPTLRN